jgi:hypothetical protein
VNAPILSNETFDTFFAYSPLVLGLAIYAVFFIAKRSEVAVDAPIGKSDACADCGHRHARHHMVPAQRDGAVGWVCQNCAAKK